MNIFPSTGNTCPQQIKWTAAVLALPNTGSACKYSVCLGRAWELKIFHLLWSQRAVLIAEDQNICMAAVKPCKWLTLAFRLDLTILLKFMASKHLLLICCVQNRCFFEVCGENLNFPSTGSTVHFRPMKTQYLTYLALGLLDGMVVAHFFTFRMGMKKLMNDVICPKGLYLKPVVPK